MKLTYAELLATRPIHLENIGHLRRIKVEEAQNDPAYRFYIAYCTSTVEDYFEQQKQMEFYDSLTIEEKANLNIFDLLISDEGTRFIFQESLDFFFEETVTWNDSIRMFILTDQDGNDVGIIHSAIWIELRDLIAETNYIKLDDTSADLSTIQNSRARYIAEKLQKGRRKLASEKSKAKNPITDFGNVISVIAAYMPGYTHLNIGDLTIYQLYDLYHRFQINESFQVVRTSVAVWGDEKKQFDLSERQQNLHASKETDSE